MKYEIIKKRIQMKIIFIMFFCIGLMVSCVEREVDKIQGDWGLITKIEEGELLHSGDSLIEWWFGTNTQSYLTFNGNGIQSLELPQLIKEKGYFKIEGDTLITIMNDGWEERNLLKVNDDTLILVRLINNKSSEFKYEKIKKLSRQGSNLRPTD